METEPQQQGEVKPPCSHCGQVHPGVGCSGFAPPEEHRFKPGQSGNPGGKVKGSFSVRRALMREFARGHEADEDGIGKKARELAELLELRMRAGDKEALDCALALVHELEGKPREHVEHSGETVRTIIVQNGPLEAPEMP